MLIYNDTVEFSFEEKGHKYIVSRKVDDQWTIPTPVVGTTTVCGIINKPALMLWPMNEALKYLRGLGEISLDEPMLREAANAHKLKSQYGKDAGHVGHSTIEALLLGKEPEKPPKELVDAYNSIKDAFEKYQEDFKPDIIKSEEPFFSLTHNFAGKIDDLSTINDKLILTDYKTSSSSFYNPEGIYKENFAQLGGYLVGVEEMTGLEIDDAQIVNLPKDGSGYKVKSLTDLGLTTTDAKLYFLNCLGLYNMDGLFGSRLK